MPTYAYDEDIRLHYESVARQDGLSPTSTMADLRTRRLETDLILNFTASALEGRSDALVIDVGCGNGYTLAMLAETFPQIRLAGYELTDSLRALATERFEASRRVTIKRGDIREPGFAGGDLADIAIVQRVVINLLEEAHQHVALSNIARALKPGGAILFIEGFTSGLDNLNAARAEFDLDPVPPAHHNVLLSDTFFDAEPLLTPYVSAHGAVPYNFLSTHYFTTRVLHPLALGERPFVRGSHFVQFMSQALAQNIGHFSPVCARAFTRRETDA